MRKSKVKDVEFVEVTKDVEPVEEVVETVVEETVENVEEVVEPVAEETVENVEEEVNDIPAPGNLAEGVVINCIRVYVRKEPSKDSEAIRTLDKNTSVTVNLDKSTDDFYNVYSLDFDGYCMKNFLQIK